MFNNTKLGYGWIAIAFHWLSVVVIIGMFALGWWMVELNYYSDWYKTAPNVHKSIGILLFVLTLGRIVYKLLNAKPVGIGNTVEKQAAKIAHAILYLLIVIIGLSGYLISTADGRGIDVFTWFTVAGFGSVVDNQADIAGFVHEYAAYTIIALALLHALAALKHHFINKDNTLKRMLSPRFKSE